MARIKTLTSVGGLLLAGALSGQTLDPYFSGQYTLANLGGVPGTPGSLSGLIFDPQNPDFLFVGVNSNLPEGALHRIQVARDATGRIVGFNGRSVQRSIAPQIDGGLCVAPNGVLFYACYPTNEIGQITPQSVGPLKTSRLGAVGIDDSIGAIRFVPPGFPGAGRMKLVSYTSGQWYDVQTQRDGTNAGTWDFVGSQEVTASTITGGAGSFFYVDRALPRFDRPSILMSEFDFRSVSAFEVNAEGDPIVSTRRPFLRDFLGVQGGTVDPVTGDFLFSSMITNQILLVSRPTSSIRLSGTVTLQDYQRDPKDNIVSVQFRRASDGALFETQSVRLLQGGALQVATGLLGDFDVRVKASRWLSKTVRVRLTSGTSIGHAFDLMNGDVNGDNTVNTADFLKVRAAFGSRSGDGNWNASADLNGDGTVGVQDFLIVRKNFGRSGS